MSNEMVDRALRAWLDDGIAQRPDSGICPFDELDADQLAAGRHSMHAAIAALREPTEAMLNKGLHDLWSYDPEADPSSAVVVEIFQTMIDEALR
jgi:hypothetical protein